MLYNSQLDSIATNEATIQHVFHAQDHGDHIDDKQKMDQSELEIAFKELGLETPAHMEEDHDNDAWRWRRKSFTGRVFSGRISQDLRLPSNGTQQIAN
jgi:hypothetical protein